MKKLIISLALIAGVVTIGCRKETIVERIEVQKGNKILSGTGIPEATLGEEGDYYLDLTNANLYGAKSKSGWGLPLSLKGTPGANGQTPRIGENGNWYVGDTDLGVKAKGSPGTNGLTPRIGENGNWFVGDTDLGVKAQGAPGVDGLTPHIGDNGNWFVGNIDLGVKAQRPQSEVGGQNGQNNPGTNGVSPHIGGNGNWFVGTTDTGVKAQGTQGIPGTPGANGVSPHIGGNGNWFVGTTDTGVKAQGVQGTPGTNGRDGKDGSKIYGGIGAPANSRGNEGDWYIDTQNKRLYGPKTATGWPTTYMSLTASEGQAQSGHSGHSNDYDLSPDGKTLKFWKNRSTTTLDMEADPILKNVTTIGDQAFYGQTNLTSIVFPKGLKVIGEGAFMYCNLTTLVIPENVVQIVAAAFYNNKQLTKVTFNSENPPYTPKGRIFEDTGKVTAFVPAGSEVNYKSVLGVYVATKP